MAADERTEELLEALWEALEEGATQRLPGPADLAAMAGQGLLVESVVGPPRFTEAGRDRARGVIRRHRLAERLFTDVVAADRSHMEEAACQVEHALKEGVEEKVCQLLGHPETCPHGRPIPAGACCRRARRRGPPAVAPLSHLAPGESGVVAYLKTRDSKQIQKLMAMGVLPGSPVRVDRSYPSFVFTVGYSQYAVDGEMADLILVRRTPGDGR